jgi:hypothetical protein
MAVENQPPVAQPASPRPATSREIIQIVGAAIALVMVIVAGMSLVVSMTLAPMREDMRLVHEDMRLIRAEMQRGFEAVDSEFKAVREDVADIRERLTRVETLLERNAGQPGSADTPQP